MVLELPQNARSARAFEDGAHLGDAAVPPRQAAQMWKEKPVIKSEGDDGEEETYQHVVHSLRFEFVRANAVRSPPRPNSGLPEFGTFRLAEIG